MVNRHRLGIFIIGIALLLCIALPSVQMAVLQPSISYHINQEWVIVWVNQDRSISIQYNISITYESSAQGYITIGMPASGFTINYVNDPAGNALSHTDTSSGSDYSIEVYFGHPMNPGDVGNVIVSATVPNILYSDSMNPGNVGMQFVPTYFPDASVYDLRLAIVPPSGVNDSNVKTTETANFTTIDGSFALYWEKLNLAPGTQLTFGISFPEQYVNPTPASSGTDWISIGGAAFVVLVIAGAAISSLRRASKATYEKPKASIEALGPARGLMAVEAAVVVGVEPVKTLSMILFGLLRKGLAKVIETDPVIKLKAIEPASLSPDTPHPNYYEIDFINAIAADGQLDEMKLAKAYLSLRDSVDVKMRGYSRADTVNYYKSVVDQAWSQVTQAGTPELKGDAIDKNLEWLIMDEKYSDKFRETFPPGSIIVPYGWYWNLPHGPTPVPTAAPSPSTTTTATAPIPAQEWANNMVQGLEKMSNNLVKNVQDFSNKLIAPAAAKSNNPVHPQSNCVCACAHCACACACVSCACACAGGGAR